MFRNLTGSKTSAYRPPWAVPAFLDICSRCNQCIEACEESILKIGDGGFPEIDFNAGGCSFCEKCVTACKDHALDREQGEAWRLKAVVGDNCLSANGIVCRSCGDACDQHAILFRIQRGGKALAVINVERCNGCGFCYSMCPEKAIQLEEII